MTSCVAIAQLRAGRKIFNRQHLQELAMRRRGGRVGEWGAEEEDRRKFNHCEAPLTDKRIKMLPISSIQTHLKCIKRHHKSYNWSSRTILCRRQCVFDEKCFDVEATRVERNAPSLSPGRNQFPISPHDGNTRTLETCQHRAT